VKNEFALIYGRQISSPPLFQTDIFPGKIYNQWLFFHHYKLHIMYVVSLSYEFNFLRLGQLTSNVGNLNLRSVNH
jgi:hypothetical protein